MHVQLASPTSPNPDWTRPAGPKSPTLHEGDSHHGDSRDGNNEELREAFQSFVGQTLFGQLLHAMRKTLGKPAYFHGGRAEEIFQGQLDQVLAEKIADTSGGKLSEAMFDLFTMNRR
jgi:hypothetical protein